MRCLRTGLPIKNCVVDAWYRKKAYEFIRREVEAGHQAYVICPMVEESEAIDAENVVEYTEVLRTELPPAFTIEYLHGKMKPKEKNEIMERFLEGEIQVLVSTTVIEVGVNVPNATVMMVENSERFGLAQLHQLRGRVGRGRCTGVLHFSAYAWTVSISGNGWIFSANLMTDSRSRIGICSCADRGIFLVCGRVDCWILRLRIFTQMRIPCSRQMRQ